MRQPRQARGRRGCAGAAAGSGQRRPTIRAPRRASGIGSRQAADRMTVRERESDSAADHQHEHKHLDRRLEVIVVGIDLHCSPSRSSLRHPPFGVGRPIHAQARSIAVSATATNASQITGHARSPTIQTVTPQPRIAARSAQFAAAARCSGVTTAPRRRAGWRRGRRAAGARRGPCGARIPPLAWPRGSR